MRNKTCWTFRLSTSEVAYEFVALGSAANFRNYNNDYRLLTDYHNILTCTVIQGSIIIVSFAARGRSFRDDVTYSVYLCDITSHEEFEAKQNYNRKKIGRNKKIGSKAKIENKKIKKLP
jgi:hypothetical protein